MSEPGQIDMMNEDELRKELRRVVIENIRLTELKEWLFREFNRLFAALDKRK